MTFSALKRQSLELMRTSRPRSWIMAFIYLALSYVLSRLSARIMGINMTIGRLEQYMEHIENGSPEKALALLNHMRPSAGGYVLSLALDLALMVVFAGFVIYLFHLIRGTEASYGNLLDGFGLLGRIVLLQILTTVYVFLWSLLLFIPGIIASYRYKMALFLLLDHPEMSVSQCIRESGQMMKGHKWNYFLLELSFIGWALLSGLGFVGYLVQLFTLPYMNLTYCLYYENLRTAA